MVKNALIIVPHPDDEINLASGLFEDLVRNDVYTTVVICSNGDYIPSYARDRYKEAYRVKNIFKYDELIFLGYGDDYIGTHIYEAKNDIPAISYCKRSSTYSTGNVSEYCYKRYHIHHTYTRDNLKKDISSIISEKKADFILCVDVDAHPDHRAVSLLFDECMGEILKENIDYHPIILKGFAYMGVWRGAYDLFLYSERSMQPCFQDGLNNTKLARPYDWNARIRIKAPLNNTSLFLWKNKLFKALWANKSQCRYTMSFFPRIANSDVCFWYRSPYNIALHSKIQTSSGNPSYLNDFLLVCPSNIRAKGDSFFESSIPWRSEDGDVCPSIKLEFDVFRNVSIIKIYQHEKSQIVSLKVSSDNGYSEVFKCDNSCVIELHTSLPRTKDLLLSINEFQGECVAIEEIECYENNIEFPWNELPFIPYNAIDRRRPTVVAVLSALIYKVFLKLLDIIKMPPTV